MASLDDQKRALRAEVRTRLAKPGSPELAATSARAQERLAATALQTGGTASAGAALEAAGRQVCYPAVVPGMRALQFRRTSGAFAAGALGVEEPAGAPVPLEAIELLVVPAIAVDASGRRLGRGKGHYDATLLAYKGPSVALVFDSQLVPEVPVGEHDRRVGAVCTELRWIAVP